MSAGARIGLVVATIVVIVVAFVALSPGGDDTKPSRTTTGATTGAAKPAAAQPAAAAYTTIRVQGGKPVGGVKTITLHKGDPVRIEVSSPDTSAEIHLHGYDLKRELKAGGRVRYAFAADAEGVFEIEVEDSGTQIGKLVVEP